ncbi:unnamed protein product, partial [Rotaria sordida]
QHSHHQQNQQATNHTQDAYHDLARIDRYYDPDYGLIDDDGHLLDYGLIDDDGHLLDLRYCCVSSILVLEVFNDCPVRREVL